MFCFTSRVTNRISALTVRRTLISSPHGALDSRRLLHNPEGVRLGWSKDVISNFLPFTSELITSKGRPFENIAIGYCPAQPPVVTAEDKIDGTTIRHGKLFEILDGLAGDVSYRHCGGRSKDLTIVTASVDGMKTSASIDIKNDLKLQGYLTYVGRSSMEVAIDLISISPEGSSKVVGNIQFIMVARNETGTASHPVCGLLLANEEARQKFAQGKERVAERKERALSSLSLTPPRPEEISLIHSLYLKSMNLKAQKDLIMQNQLAQLVASLKDSPGTATVGSSFQSLSEPHLFRSKFKWMRNTIFKNVEIMFPQDRNVHGKIFGGYLMRKAFELAWVSAVCFTGEQNPCFLYVDDIQFVKPVSIGSVMEFSSTVVYSRDQYMVVQVLALDVNPANAVKSKTNIYRYVFRANAAAGTSLPQVMPREYEEIVLYLEGKRSLDQLLLDDEQHSV